MFSKSVEKLLALSRKKTFIKDSRVLREKFKQTVNAYGGPKPALPLVENVCIDHVPVRFYYPNLESLLPVIVYFHGGGHTIGSVELFDSQTRLLAKYTNCVVVSVDYRLAPEYPYPHGLNDCIAVTEHLIRYYDRYNILPSIFVAGDSGGGNFAANVALKYREKLAGQILIYPSTDFSMVNPSIEKFGQGYLLDQEKMRFYFDGYLPKEAHRQSPALSPLYAEHKGLPPTFIAVADHDPLFDDGQLYAEKLKAEHVEVVYREYANTLHAFATLYQLFPEQCEAMYHDMADFIRARGIVNERE